MTNMVEDLKPIILIREDCFADQQNSAKTMTDCYAKKNSKCDQLIMVVDEIVVFDMQRYHMST